jgi:hypothetical protein
MGRSPRGAPTAPSIVAALEHFADNRDLWCLRSGWNRARSANSLQIPGCALLGPESRGPQSHADLA